MLHPDKLPPELLTGPFTTGEAHDLGIGRGWLRHRKLVRLSRGIRTVEGADSSLALLTRPYCIVTGHAAASHATALEIWGMPGFHPDRGGPGIHIARQAPHTMMRRRGVIAHKTQFRNDEVVFLDGLWITTRARTWLDCARKMSIEELVVGADHLLRIPRPVFEARTAPYATRADLELAI
ncbi:hypothetical protein [Specibacter cremeus]|uniref:hypothetical protein n=1 Tax=Specibacter cremeus TaxID=1629051 RepID=UPI000F7BAB6C|nr:hypothetical protein [Specibacter cremeus]